MLVHSPVLVHSLCLKPWFSGYRKWQFSFSSSVSSSSSLQLERKRNLFQLLYVRRQNQVAGSLLFPSLHFHFHHLHSLFMNHEQTTTVQNHSKITVKPAGTLLSSSSEPPSERKSFSSFHMLNGKTRLLPEPSFSHRFTSIWIICISSSWMIRVQPYKPTLPELSFIIIRTSQMQKKLFKL